MRDAPPKIDEDDAVESAEEGNVLPAGEFEVEEDCLVVDFQASALLLREHPLLELKLAVGSVDDLSHLLLARVLLLGVLKRDVVVEIAQEGQLGVG